MFTLCFNEEITVQIAADCKGSELEESRGWESARRNQGGLWWRGWGTGLERASIALYAISLYKKGCGFGNLECWLLVKL